MGPTPVPRSPLAAPPRTLGMVPPEPCQLRPALVRAESSGNKVHEQPFTAVMLPGCYQAVLIRFSSLIACVLGQS
eukprot:6876611-Prymnesium_polylepis.1